MRVGLQRDAMASRLSKWNKCLAIKIELTWFFTFLNEVQVKVEESA